MTEAVLSREQLQKGFAILAAFVVLRAALAQLGNVNEGLQADWQSLLFLIGAFLILSVGLVYFGFTRWVGIDLRRWWRFERRRIRGDIGWGLLGSLISFILNIGVVLAFVQLGLLPTTGMNSDAGSISPTSYLMSLFFGFAIASFQEETIFRGFLQGVFETRFTPWKANLLQATIFAMAHIGYLPLDLWSLYILVFLQGLLFGWLRLKRGTLIASWIAHGLVG